MKQLLLNCDQVFEVLTRGPFPTGEPIDKGVEHHLRACHACRQLAEALRPAVSLLHEAVVGDQARELPEYQGSLPLDIEPTEPRSLRLGARQIPRASRGGARSRSDFSRLVRAVRLIAASLLVAALGMLLYGLAMSGGSALQIARVRSGFASPPRITTSHVNPRYQPDQQGLLTLAALKLPAACLSASHRPLSADHAAQLIAAMADGSLGSLHCCTECHHAGRTPPAGAPFVASIQQHCQTCHRG